MHSNIAKTFVYLLFFFIFNLNFDANSSSKQVLYSHKSISDYFSGLVSSNNNNHKLAIKYFNNLKHLKNDHDQFNREIIIALVQSNKISESFLYLKKLKKENINFFQANLLLGVNYLVEKKFNKSGKYFSSIIENKKFYDMERLIAEILLNYVKIFNNRSYDFNGALLNVPGNYENLVLIQKAFLNCYLDNEIADESFLKLIDSNTLNFMRYNFFYVNFLISKNYENEAKKILENKTNTFDHNLLLEQSRFFLNEGKGATLKEMFNCANPNHLAAEFFYLIANYYSGDGKHNLSNFYLNLSLYLNPDFIFNNLLLAENYFLLENFDDSRQIYSMFDSKNSVYDWYAQKRLALIKSKFEDNESALSFLNKSFKKINKPNAKHYYDLANFYKDYEKYEESIKYYNKVLSKVDNDDPMYPKILHKRGMSYERLKLWKKSDDDLTQSLNLSPKEPYVLNYLAYSWLERNINLDKSIEMLKMAFDQKKDDPYIIDSLGWGMYLTGRYHEAERLLQKAVKLMPLDPIVNDHYGDILFKLDKNLQANYFWNYVLSLENTEEEMKEKIKKKLIFGIKNNS